MERFGGLLLLRLASGRVGLGDVAPLPGLHQEGWQDALAQASALAAALRGSEVPLHALGSSVAMDQWLEQGLGLDPADLLPSVRSALESALLTAALTDGDQQSVRVNGLVDGVGPVDAMLQEARTLVADGCRCLKVKVGRRADPAEDAAALAALQQALPGVLLRADANRLWGRPAADRFAGECRRLGVLLEYLEEPLNEEDTGQLLDFASQWDLPVALDESLDRWAAKDGWEAAVDRAAGLTERGQGVVAAVVAKPSLLGGPLRCRDLARRLGSSGARLVLSSSFESPLGLAALAAAAPLVVGPSGDTAHGLGTLGWFPALLPGPQGDALAALRGQWDLPPSRPAQLLEAALPLLPEPSIQAGVLEVELPSTGQRIRLHWIEGGAEAPCPGRVDTVVGLHGFLGAAGDLSGLTAGAAAACGARWACIDLPGHGSSGPGCSVEAAAEALAALTAARGWGRCLLLGYSLGGRVALAAALGTAMAPAGVLLLSSTPGISDPAERAARAEADLRLAGDLVSGGLGRFLGRWYAGPLWGSLRSHPAFPGRHWEPCCLRGSCSWAHPFLIPL